ncbi:MAG: lipopolysaccharide biosynthesis protein [Muribaculaceae bacterium]|nr:lipopolysaccharide biosynthesis protein [Muribaculaceae bacterium]
MSDSSLKLKTARTLKWNLIDRVSTQILYAVTGIVLARELSQEDFGLVGAILVFQTFALLMVEGGLSYGLIQRKTPSDLDYSSALWFNVTSAGIIYVLLFLVAPWIADIFGGDPRLIPLSRVMFLTFILNAPQIVQANRFIKQMNVKPVAVANSVSLAAGGAVGVVMAFNGFGAWSLVCQSITLSAVKSIMLWTMSRWRPLMSFSFHSIRSLFKVSGGMMLTSFLNTLFLNLYSFLIGNRVGLVSLGYYTQGDKWSKVCIMSIGQVLTSSFLPVLSGVQDDPVRFNRLTAKMNRMAAYFVFPIFIGLIVEAPWIFNALFGSKWDGAIILFQLLLVRGIFWVFTNLYTNYLVALGHAGTIARLEVVRDAVAIIGLVLTFPVMGLSTPEYPTLGIAYMLLGQIAAGIIAWLLTIVYVHRHEAASWRTLLTDYVPYLAMSLCLGALMFVTGHYVIPSLFPDLGTTIGLWLTMAVTAIIGLAGYLAVNAVLHSRIQGDVIAYVRGKL